MIAASPRGLPAPTSLRAAAAQALIELADRAGDLPPELDLLAKIHLPRTVPWPEVFAAPRPATPHDRALLELAEHVRLTHVELLAIALLAAVEDDPVFARAVARMQAPAHLSRPTLGLLAAVCAPLAADQVTAFHELVAGHARETGVLVIHDVGVPLAEQSAALAPPIYLAVCRRDAVLAGLMPGEPAAVPLPASLVIACSRLATALRDGDRALMVRASSPLEGRTVCVAIAAARGQRAAFLDDTPIPGLGPYLTLRRLVPVFVVDLGPGERKRLVSPRGYHGPVLVLASREGTVELDGTSVPSWPVPVPSPREREILWHAELDDRELAHTLGTEYRHGASRIAQLARSARRLASIEGNRLQRRHVRDASWISEGPGLGGLAEPLRDEIPDEAMVTTPTLRRDLDLLLARCLAREGLGTDLGTAIRARMRPGVRAMFVGPSGTGKTLAASWLATRLALPLYRVDLASVTSKYIGETEKNLAQVLSRAEHEEIVLLFDEADSMFGKRTDVKEANDRFANAQTNFLLQRIESFDGIVVLTSNSRSRLDPAFTRRLDSVIEFPLPGPEERRALWQAHLGTAHDLDAAAINRLAASVDLVGGHIRNAVLSAAVLARRAARRICFADLVTGLLVEYRKLGRSVPPELQREQ
jgi:hypothetical protein